MDSIHAQIVNNFNLNQIRRKKMTIFQIFCKGMMQNHDVPLVQADGNEIERKSFFQIINIFLIDKTKIKAF